MESYDLIVFFDGGCPLCRREIDHYRRLEARKPILWIDVTQPDAPLSQYGVERETAMRRFHVMDDHGQFFVGAQGFVTLWTQLPYYHYLASVIRRLSMLPLLDRIYVRFADWHYGRRCRDGLCVPARGDKSV